MTDPLDSDDYEIEEAIRQALAPKEVLRDADGYVERPQKLYELADQVQTKLNEICKISQETDFLIRNIETIRDGAYANCQLISDPITKGDYNNLARFDENVDRTAEEVALFKQNIDWIIEHTTNHLNKLCHAEIMTEDEYNVLLKNGYEDDSVIPREVLEMCK